MNLLQRRRLNPGFVLLPLRQTNAANGVTALNINILRPRATTAALLFTQRCRISTTCSANLTHDKGLVKIRRANKTDVHPMADLTARAFCEQDQLLVYLQTKLSPSFGQLLGLIEMVYTRISIKDIMDQLQKRIGTAGQSAHIALVAEQTETGELMGCLEMGMVNTGKLSSARAGYAIEQWENEIAQMAKNNHRIEAMLEKEPENFSSDGVISLSEKTALFEGRAPYIGNLAVSRKFRRLGVASSLVAEACKQAEELWDARCVWLHVEAKNQAAAQLYRKMDFGCEAQDPDWMEEVGKQRRLLLRSIGGSSDWGEAKTSGVKLNGWEYLRWCWNDLARVRRERE